MSQTSLMVIMLVIIGLAYTKGRATSAKKANVPIFGGGAYAALLAVALALAVLWH
jgi:hypothetical protein